jgi:hypothetical protein
MNDTVNEVSLLFPQGKEIEIKGEKLVIKPFGFGKFPKVVKLMKDFTPPKDGTSVTMGNIAEMLADNSEAVMELSVLATGKPREWFDSVAMDEGVVLLKTIVEVNADFFVKRLQPRTLEAINQLQESLGALSSQSL